MQSPDVKLGNDIQSYSYSKSDPRTLTGWRRWVAGWNKIVALIALFNLLLGLFNLSYIPLRDVYLRQFPTLVALYDPVKAIEPHPDTQRYLWTVDRLTEQVPQLGLESPQVAQTLAELRQQSDDLIEENPFLAAHKFGTFAELRQRIRDRVQADSATDAFLTFWTSPYLMQEGWYESLDFFSQQLRPLLRSNYFRPLNEMGQYVDRFWQIDLYFIGFFALDLLGRTVALSRQASISWWNAILRRWYDILLLLPVWRWLRVIPVAIRLHQSRLVDMGQIVREITHEPAAYIADRVSKFVLIQIVNQMQDAIAQKGIAGLLRQEGDYIRVSDVNKVDAISDRLLQLTIYKVLPQVQPNLRGVLQHSLEESFKQFDVFQRIEAIPAIGTLPAEATEQLADYLAQALGDTLAASYADVEGRVLLDRLAQDIKQTLQHELRDAITQRELELLITDLLEELKLNYVQKATEYNPQRTVVELDQMSQVTGEPL